jgi:outer membrane protein
MKINTIKFLSVLAFVLITFVNKGFAQKIGYTNAETVLMQLPEAKTIEAEMKAFSAQLGKELENKQKEFQTKYQTYVAEAEKLAVVVREQREKELQTMNQSLQEFQQKAEQEVQKKQQTLLSPVFDKIQKAIDEIAKAENFDMIISTDASGAPILLYAKEEHNITNKVITKLGGTPLPTTPKN